MRGKPRTADPAPRPSSYRRAGGARREPYGAPPP